MSIFRTVLDTANLANQLKTALEDTGIGASIEERTGFNGPICRISLFTDTTLDDLCILREALSAIIAVEVTGDALESDAGTLIASPGNGPERRS